MEITTNCDSVLRGIHPNTQTLNQKGLNQELHPNTCNFSRILRIFWAEPKYDGLRQ